MGSSCGNQMATDYLPKISVKSYQPSLKSSIKFLAKLDQQKAGQVASNGCKASKQAQVSSQKVSLKNSARLSDPVLKKGTVASSLQD